MQIPIQTTETDAKSRGFIRAAIANAEPVFEQRPSDDPEQPDPVLVPLGFDRGTLVISGIDFVLTWRWVIDFAVTLDDSPNFVIPTRINFIFESKPLTIVFEPNQNRILVEFKSEDGGGVDPQSQ